MTTSPLYDQTVTDLGFDPATVSPRSTRTDRKVAHERWWAEVQRKPVLTIVPSPKPRARKTKAASR